MSACTACGADAVVQWRRLPTKDDLLMAARFEATRRAVRMAAAARLEETVAEEPPQLGGEVTVPVYACVEHALSPEAAGYVHQAACTGPGKGGSCSCPVAEPEFPFVPVEDPRGPAKKRLPAGW
ncbi:hypothetical protein [Streptomyces virginiae]|uniref:Uncharacterized protein n=1 Tax=Streptomyces virginiae TaxID=1961 RepID=A0ABZ1TEE2_STRVG|nr:hypothetical protein [Streptomyces virginiae]